MLLRPECRLRHSERLDGPRAISGRSASLIVFTELTLDVRSGDCRWATEHPARCAGVLLMSVLESRQAHTLLRCDVCDRPEAEHETPGRRTLSGGEIESDTP